MKSHLNNVEIKINKVEVEDIIINFIKSLKVTGVKSHNRMLWGLFLLTLTSCEIEVLLHCTYKNITDLLRRHSTSLAYNNKQITIVLSNKYKDLYYSLLEQMTREGLNNTNYFIFSLLNDDKRIMTKSNFIRDLKFYLYNNGINIDVKSLLDKENQITYQYGNNPTGSKNSKH